MGIARRVTQLWSLFVLTIGVASACTLPTNPPVAPGQLTIGAGSNNPTAFVNAYNAEGSSTMGDPASAVQHWGSSCMQLFSSAKFGQNAIVQPNCANAAYAVVGEFWTYTQGKGSNQIGYPIAQAHRWGNNDGWVQDFDGGSIGRNIVARGDIVKQVHTVHNDFLGWYYNNNGPAGYLRWPTGEEYNYCAGIRQDFEGGSGMWDTTNGARAATSCTPSIGSGSAAPQAFVDAYDRVGSTKMGTPAANVEMWGSACLQRFSSALYGENAIVQPNCSGTAYSLIGDFWGYAKAKGPGNIGYPVMDGHRWGNDTGWAQDFDGGAMQHTIVARGDIVKQPHGVSRGFLGWYVGYGDAGGYLHWPISEEYNYCAGTRQDFEGGSLMWDSSGGVRPTTGCGTATPSGHPPSSARNIGYNPYAANYSNQCTYYAEQRMANQTGMYMPVTGNAYQFADQAAAGGWTVGSTPVLNSVAVFPAGSFGSSVGHVGWVIQVNSNQLRIQDYNWGWVGAVVTDHWVTMPAGTRFIYSDR